MDPALTSLAGLRREKRRRGQRRCRCPEHQLRMLSHSTVRVGPGPSSRCSRTSCLRARTAVFSNICSNCRGAESRHHLSLVSSSPPTTPGRAWVSKALPSPMVRVHMAWHWRWRPGNRSRGEVARHGLQTWPSVGSWSPSPTMRMQSAWRRQRTVQGVSDESVW